MTDHVAQWLLPPALPAARLREFRGMSPVLAQILCNRGLTAPEDAGRFLQGAGAAVDPFALKDMQRAVGRIRQALRQGEAIVVYGDFDADGVSATALLLQTLNALGGCARAYIPHRVSEGYGLNRARAGPAGG